VVQLVLVLVVLVLVLVLLVVLLLLPHRGRFLACDGSCRLLLLSTPLLLEQRRHRVCFLHQRCKISCCQSQPGDLNSATIA
jgi:hypothetical protein